MFTTKHFLFGVYDIILSYFYYVLFSFLIASVLSSDIISLAAPQNLVLHLNTFSQKTVLLAWLSSLMTSYSFIKL